MLDKLNYLFLFQRLIKEGSLGIALTNIFSLEVNRDYVVIDVENIKLIKKIIDAISFKSDDKELKEEFASLFDKVVGLGMMRGLRCKSGVDLGMIIQKASKEGVLVLKAGRNVIRFLPPLTITKEEINEGFIRFEKTLKNIK